MLYGGYQVFPSPLFVNTERYQTRFPKKKKNRRWTKKFAKKYIGFRNVPKQEIIIDSIRKAVFCHTDIYNQMKAEFLSSQYPYAGGKGE